MRALLLFILTLAVGSALAGENPGQAAPPAQPKPDDGNLKADEVLVIANKASPDSLAVANYYMQKRAIPKAQLFTVDFPKYQHPNGISFNDYQTKIVAPLKKFLEDNKLKDKILCFVTVWNVPYVVDGPNITKEEMDQLGRGMGNAGQVLTTRAAVDAELAWLYRNQTDALKTDDIAFRRSYCGTSPNFFCGRPTKFRQFRKDMAADPQGKTLGMLYMTARLEAPTLELTKGLVDLAMQAEKDGPAGIGYFDAKMPAMGHRKMGYSMGEFWVRRAWIETSNAGFKTVKDETDQLFGDGACPDALFYWGWYALTDYRDSFKPKFKPGAIAVHTASGEATNIRSAPPKGGPWCAGFLAHGVTICSGPVGEPFLHTFPNAEIFYPRFFMGWTAGEAYWNSVVSTSWMMVLIGDPLYTPFAGKNKRTNYAQSALQFIMPNSAQPTPQPANNARSELVVLFKSVDPIFKNTKSVKLIDPKTNDSKIKLVDLDKATVEVKEDDTLLIVRGAFVELADFGPFDQRSEMVPELEVHVDLGEAGKKIVSQQFVPQAAPAAPPNPSPAPPTQNKTVY